MRDGELQEIVESLVLALDGGVLIRHGLDLVEMADEHALEVRAIRPRHHLAVALLHVADLHVEVDEQRQQDDDDDAESG